MFNIQNIISETKVTVLKVEAVEVGALHQVAKGFRFKRRKARVTYLAAVEKQTGTLD